MIKENKVSLWLGYFEEQEDFTNYVKVLYDEEGNYITSKFQLDYSIEKYNLDTAEMEWLSESCTEVEELLAGFSGDYEIIPQFEIMLRGKDIQKVNSIVLLYNFEYDNDKVNCDTLEFIGCANVSL